MKNKISEITKYIQIAKEKQKEGNLNQANEIYKKLINQKIYTADLLISYAIFNRDINNLEIAKNLFIFSTRKYPLKIRPYFLLAEILRNQNKLKDFDEARLLPSSKDLESLI